MQKRILSFILCAVLICGLFPTTATAMGSQAEYTGVCTHGSHEGYIELTSEYLATHNDRLSSGKYYLSGDLNYSGSYYLDVAQNANVELCLNGHTLTFSNQYLLVLDDASLLLENGKVKLESSANKVIWGYNSEAVEIRNCDIDGNGTATYLIFINGDTGAQEVKITDSKLHNICDSSYAAVSMFGENPLGSLDISRTDIYDLAGASNGIYLDCATAKISNCTLDGGGIVNSLAHISEVSNVSITKNGIGLRNDGTIDIIKNCTIVSNGASIQNEGLIKEISGGSYTYNPTIFQEGALQNSGTINDITNNAKFSGAPAIKNEGSGKITITDAEVLGSVDGLTAGFAIYGYAVTPSATGMVTINGGNYSCAVYDPNNTSAAEKLFPDGATGIIINSGNFEHSPSANLLAPNKAIVNSGNTNFPYTVGEPGYTVTYELDGGTNNEANPVSYNSSVGIPELKAPVKADYAFLGWTMNEGTDYITAVPTGTTGDITLKAHWEYKPVYHTVKLFDITGFTANQQPTTNVANGATYTVLLTATSNEYLVSTFDEYHVRYENGMIVSNATSSYDETAKTVTITIPNVSANIEIICKARICSHDYEEKVITPATCTTSGSKTLTCKICSNVITPVTIDPINHSWGDWTKISSTQHQRVCKNDASHVETENHNFDGRTCTDCGYIKPSSGGSGVITYAISVEDAENGEVSANRSSASRGTTVTLTADPDKGYILESITVTDKNGDEVKLTKKDGKYTFTMPASKVTVKASFMKENPNTGAWENPFADVVEGAWYYDSIRYAYENGLIAGYPNGLFGINDTITRGQIATILWRMEESPVVNYAMTFEDVGAGMYYAEAIRWAASEGIVGGYTATQFGPDDAITREQLAAILWRYAQHKKYDVSVGEDTNILSYADALTVSEWAVPAMQWANGVGLIQGSDNNLMPKGNATRAQAAAILHRFCETVTGE